MRGANGRGGGAGLRVELSSASTRFSASSTLRDVCELRLIIEEMRWLSKLARTLGLSTWSKTSCIVVGIGHSFSLWKGCSSHWGRAFELYFTCEGASKDVRMPLVGDICIETLFGVGFIDWISSAMLAEAGDFHDSDVTTLAVNRWPPNELSSTSGCGTLCKEPEFASSTSEAVAFCVFVRKAML